MADINTTYLIDLNGLKTFHDMIKSEISAATDTTKTVTSMADIAALTDEDLENVNTIILEY